MYRVHKPGYDVETMRAVATAYRRERQAGRLDGPAREAAIAAFRAQYPAPALGRKYSPHDVRLKLEEWLREQTRTIV